MYLEWKEKQKQVKFVIHLDESLYIEIICY